MGDAESAGETPDPAGPEPAEVLAGRGAAQPRSLAILRPTRLAGPAAGPSVAWPSSKPARIREACFPGHTPDVRRAGPAGGAHRFPGAWFVNELTGRARRHVVEEFPVHRHDGRVVTGGVALDVLEDDLAVRRRLVVADAEMLGELGEYLVTAHHCAQRVGAHADVVLADRTALVHGVKAHHCGAFRLGQPEFRRAVLDAVGGDEAFLRLDEMEQRQQRRPRPRVLAGDLRRVRVEAGAHIVAERHYLSTPPITGSMLAIAGITSASMPPSHSAATDCMLLNDGSRKCTRSGRVPPSLTTCAPSSPRADSTAAYAWPAGTRNPSVISLKWWMSASMDWPMMCAMCSGEGPRPSGPSDSLAGQPILASRIITGSVSEPAEPRAASRPTHCLTIFSDCSISSIRSMYRPYASHVSVTGTSKS